MRIPRKVKKWHKKNGWYLYQLPSGGHVWVRDGMVFNLKPA